MIDVLSAAADPPFPVPVEEGVVVMVRAVSV